VNIKRNRRRLTHALERTSVHKSG